jgi:hypothetical protein
LQVAALRLIPICFDAFVLIRKEQRVIDLQNEQTLRLHDARKLKWLKGRDGGRVDIGTLRRWALKGIKGIKLETVRIGTTTYTSIESCLRFIERLSNTQGERPICHTSQRRHELATADKKLDQAGIT